MAVPFQVYKAVNRKALLELRNWPCGQWKSAGIELKCFQLRDSRSSEFPKTFWDRALPTERVKLYIFKTYWEASGHDCRREAPVGKLLQMPHPANVFNEVTSLKM